MNATKIAEAYALIRALRNNLDKHYTIEQKYVDQYHAAVDVLESESHKSLSGFRIPESELRRRVEHSNSLTGDVHYSENPECDREMFMVKVDALLTFFDIQTKGAAIGFTV
jgi:hypothetical protein